MQRDTGSPNPSPNPRQPVDTSSRDRRISHRETSPPKGGVSKHPEPVSNTPRRARKPREAIPNLNLGPPPTTVVQGPVRAPPTTVDVQTQRLVATNDNQEEQPVPTPVGSAPPGDETNNHSNDTDEDGPAEREVSNTDDTPPVSPSMVTSPQKDKIQMTDSPIETEHPIDKTDPPGVGSSPPTPGGDVDRSTPGTDDENGSLNLRSGSLQRLDHIEQGQDPGANQPKESLPGAKPEYERRWTCYVYGSLSILPTPHS